MKPTRREVVAWIPVAMAVVRCGPKPAPDAPLKFLSSSEASALDAYAGEVFPPDGATLGASRYVDRMLSDIEPLLTSLGTGVPLDRVAKAAWDIRVKELQTAVRAVLGKGLPFDQLAADDLELVAGLVTEAAFCRPQYGGNKDKAGWKMIGSAGDVMPDGFVKWDGTKNVELADAPTSTPEPGTDPFPLDQSTRDLLDQVVIATGGKKAM